MLQVLADSKNRQVSAKFFKFTLLMFLVPIGFLLVSIRTNLVSAQTAGIIAVLLMNAIMGVYAIGAYREEATEWNELSQKEGDKKTN